jgi:acetolactate synthase-1/2/3 large subunit
MAAEAYAKMKNDIGVALITSGPGSTNAITGLLGAFQDSIPCIFLSGQAKRGQTVYNSGIPLLRQLGVQEVNIIPIVETISKYAVMVNEPDKIRYYLEKAYFIAKSGRPGPVWLDIPLDVQNAEINVDKLMPYEASPRDLLNSLNKDVEYVINELKNAKRPVIIAGHGIRLAGSTSEFENLVNKLKVPVVTPIMGIDILPTMHGMNIGRIGTKGTRAGNFTMQNADLILSIGSRLSVSVVGHEYKSFARKAKVIVVDIDAEEHKKKTITIDKFIHSDAKDFIMQLLKHKIEWDQELHKEWLIFCQRQKERYPVCLDSYSDDSKGINYYKFIDVLTNFLPKDVAIISDAGSSFYVVSQVANIKPDQRYITSGAIATMGFGLPAAIGVSFASSMGMVAAITGDGSFNQNPQELAVMAYHKLPIKLFVADNNGYFSIRQTQKKFFGGHFVGESSLSGLAFPNLELLVKSYGVEYLLVDSIKTLKNKLPVIFGSQRPMVIDIKLLKDQEIIPTNSSEILEDGRMRSEPLEDMYPFLPRREFQENMQIEILR